MRIAILGSLAALLFAALPAGAAPLSLTLEQKSSERPYALDVSGSFGQSPTAIIVRDALFGGVIGAGTGAVAGLAFDDNHVARDLAIGAVVGIVAGAIVGVTDAQSSGPSISIHTDQIGVVAPF
jgi:putative effector of murein hydrolase